MMQTTDRLTGVEDSKVLIVEDEKSIAELYSDWLINDHEVITTNTVNDAVDSLDDSVDVVILDRRLPNGSGKHVLGYIQEEELNCLVAMVTAVKPELGIVDLPIDDYLVKPIDRTALQSTVEELLLRSTVTFTRQELLALLSRKIALEEENHPHELAEAQEYQGLSRQIDVLTQELEVSPQNISSRHRPDSCPDCSLRWNIDLEGTVGFVSMASRVWKCAGCGRVVHMPDPSNRSVTRAR